MTEQLHPIVLLRQNADDTFAFRLRWLLGKNPQLPQPDDSFELEVMLTADKRFLGPQGTFGPPGQVQTLTVAPRLFAMIDPPRVDITHPADPTKKLRIASLPTQPVSCMAELVDQALDGFGICNLLSEVQPSRAQARVERALAPVLRRGANHLAQREQPVGMASTAANDDVRRELARMLTRGGIRPRRIQRVLVDDHARLVEHTAARLEARIATRPQPVMFGDGTLTAQWARAALTFEALSDVTTLETLDDIVMSRQRVREQVRMRALHGGVLLDYWCSPDQSSPCQQDSARGKHFPGSELIGTGLTIGNFPRAEVEAWAANGGGTTVLMVTVRHLRTLPLTGVRHDGHGEPMDVFTEDDGPLDSGNFLVTTAHVRRALDAGSSLPPGPPRAASVNYDFIQSNAGVNDQPIQFGQGTGDGRVEIVITPPLANDTTKTVFGFNVYGMWEVAATKKFFDNPAISPTLDELKPWLITRKYSYEADLKGAFPSAGSMLHPGLQLALEQPPAMPRLERFTEVVDQLDPSTVEPGGGGTPGPQPPTPTALPDVFRIAADGTPQTRFDLDLRVGMDSGVDGTSRLFVGWDPGGLVKTTWDPTQTREGAPAGAAPQRYRFWVTSSDPFEQESAPIAVLANDVDAGENPSTIFVPRRRATLLPPPSDMGGGIGRTLELRPKAGAAFDIRVLWETPFLNDLGRVDGDGSTRRADARELTAAVRLFRRPLRRAITDANAFPAALRSAQGLSIGTFATPQWLIATNTLEEEGWIKYDDDANVAPPATGDTWSRDFSFTHADRGFEYVALVGVSVRADRAVFWHPDVQTDGSTTGRIAHFAVKEASGWIPRRARLAETPRTSAVVATERWRRDTKVQVGSLPVPNPAKPRGVTLKASLIHPAKPVRPPAGIDRDVVLMRLLSRAVDGGSGIPQIPLPWADTNVPLNEAQRATLETALLRANDSAGVPNPITDARVFDARRLLATDLTNGSNPSVPRQNMAIGFRGLLRLNYVYRPFDIATPTEDEAEAERVTIFLVRVPHDAARSARYATVSAQGTRADAGYVLSAISSEQRPGLEAIEQFRQPTLARIESGNSTVFAPLTRIEIQGGQTTIEVQPPPNTNLPVQATIRLYASQPIVERPLDRTKGTIDETVFLPVGGGHAEAFAWWLQTTSAQEVVSGHAPVRTPFFTLDAPPTIVPEVLAGFGVTLPPASTIAYALDPVVDRGWLPDGRTLEQVTHDPRVVVGWHASAVTDRVIIEIEREERLVERPPSLAFSALALAPSPWESIKALDALADNALIDPAWISAIRGTWLLGDVIESEPVSSEARVLIAAARGLSGAAGRKLVDLPERPQQAAFIDYFRLADNAQLVMDGNYEYRYRIRACIDLLEGAPPGSGGDSRFLRSRFTAWSEWVLPEPTGATVKPDPTPLCEPQSGTTPVVLFRLRASGEPLVAAQRGPDDGWFYRVVITRQLTFSLPANENSQREAAWREVGAPIALRPGESADIKDLRLERGTHDAAVRADYRINTRQLVIAPSGRERLVRVLDDSTLSVKVPPPDNPDGAERRVVQLVQIS